MKIYHTETQADYNALMVELEKQGAKWFLTTNPTESNNWPEFEHETGIKVQDGILAYQGVEYFERENPETPIVKYTAKKEMQLPDWANWIARDRDGELNAYSVKPLKTDGFWDLKILGDNWIEIDETDDTFSHVKWEDEEPTEVKRVTGLGMSTLDKYKSIMNAKAHGYDEVPEVADKDGVETASISFEEAMALVEIKMAYEPDTTHINTNKDMVNQPNHYIGEYGLEVEDVLRNFIPRYTDPYVGHRIASAIEYLLRSPLKNGQQDIEKARKNLDQALGYMEKKELK